MKEVRDSPKRATLIHFLKNLYTAEFHICIRSAWKYDISCIGKTAYLSAAYLGVAVDISDFSLRGNEFYIYVKLELNFRNQAFIIQIKN